MEKLQCGVIGGTGLVGQFFITLLRDHPWFQVTDIAASPRSAGKTYEKAVEGRWFMDCPIPPEIKDMVVRDAQAMDTIPENLDFVFSAVSLKDKEAIRQFEFEYAKRGIPVVSNNSAHRWTPDVPMLIGEINSHHTDIIPIQQKNRGFDRGFVVVKPNCSLQSYLTAVWALEKAGYPVENLIITTLQAVSGAGYHGVPSMAMVDNLVPFIGGEEEKTEQEPLKILGQVSDTAIENYEGILISATCTRVPVVHGHTACVSMKFKDKKPSKKEIIQIWEEFKGKPQELGTPFAPEHPILYFSENDHPQPRKHRDLEKGMAVSVGRLRDDPVFDYKFVALSHNMIRGAAGGAILAAELLKTKGYFDK